VTDFLCVFEHNIAATMDYCPAVIERFRITIAELTGAQTVDVESLQPLISRHYPRYSLVRPVILLAHFLGLNMHVVFSWACLGLLVATSCLSSNILLLLQTTFYYYRQRLKAPNALFIKVPICR
jgi:hypothetical protein